MSAVHRDTEASLKRNFVWTGMLKRQLESGWNITTALLFASSSTNMDVGLYGSVQQHQPLCVGPEMNYKILKFDNNRSPFLSFFLSGFVCAKMLIWIWCSGRRRQLSVCVVEGLWARRERTSKHIQRARKQMLLSAWQINLFLAADNDFFFAYQSCLCCVIVCLF